MTHFIVQSVLFNKNKISLDDAKVWIKNHGYKIMKIDETTNLYRVRQLNPIPYEKAGYKFRIKKINDIISFVIMYNHSLP